MPTKVCTICKTEKTLDKFGARKAVKGGYRNQCKLCINSMAKKSRDKAVSLDSAKAQEANWRRNLKRCYRLTVSDWQKMFDAQNGRCMYCDEEETQMLHGKVKRLAVDHDHNCCPEAGKSCGECIRGLSCARCNYLAGTLENNVDRIMAINKRLEIFNG